MSKKMLGDLMRQAQKLQEEMQKTRRSQRKKPLRRPPVAVWSRSLQTGRGACLDKNRKGRREP